MTDFPQTTTAWQKTGSINPNELADARLQLHWACQIPSSVGTTLLPPREDDSHTNLEWLETHALLAGQPVGSLNLRAAVGPSTMRLHLLDASGAARPTYDLRGNDYAAGVRWTQEAVEAALGAPLPAPLQRRNLEIPMHPVGEKGTQPFSAREDHLQELARWFANADFLQREFAARTPHSSPVRCWPHHLDLGMLVSREPSKGSQGKTIGIGFSPGDDNYNEPYWYVNPYPAPPVGTLPALPAGQWHTTGWVGAVLRATEIVQEKSREKQAARCTLYLGSAFDSCTAILDSSI